ncbi:tryptophan 7-halogenase [Glaciecola siphonariae]|uniref:Tryptophan 7-halogenase n=1 Tax=Glaciecola siphonariae TaxID=521012 RepID=A0ABV9LTY7_9ALTE
MTHYLQDIAVLGNTPSAWIAAIFLKQRLASSVTVVCPPLDMAQLSPSKAETLSPQIISELKKVGLQEQHWIGPAGANFCLGQRLCNSSQALDAIAPFAQKGVSLNGIAFHHYAVKAALPNVEAYSLASQMARLNKFVHPVGDHNSILSSFDYGITIDTTKFIRLMVAYAKHVGINVKQVPNLSCISLTVSKAIVSNIQLSDGSKLAAQFVIDATQDLQFFRSLSTNACTNISTNVSTPSDNTIEQHTYSSSCSVDSALGNTSANDLDACANKPQFDRRLIANVPDDAALDAVMNLEYMSGAMLASHRLRGAAYFCLYFSSESMNDNDALNVLRQVLPKSASDFMPQDIRFSPYNAQCLNKPWQGNIMALGPDTGLPAPSYFGDLAMDILNITRFINLAPTSEDMAINAREYNRVFGECSLRCEEYESTLQEVLEGKECNEKTEAKPSSLIHKQTLFRNSGRLANYDNDPLPEYAWMNLLMAGKFKPTKAHSLLDSASIHASLKQIEHIAALISDTVSKLPNIEAYRRHIKLD